MPSEMFSKSRREELALGPANRRPKNKPTAAKARITVAVRKKPLTAEEAKNDTDILDVVGRQKLVLHETRKELSGTTDKTTQQGFQFDRVYDEYCSNLTIYKSCVRTLVDSMFECGGRCSCFAFGQTGSGKTYTMMGPRKRGGKQEDSCSRGLWEWAAIDLEAWMKKPAYRERFVLAISFYEIHSNKAYDLLNNRNLVRPMESAEGGVVVKDLVIRVVTTEAEMAEVIDLGNSVRSTGKNSRNNESSRSHAILSIELVQKTDIEYRLAENPRAENPRAENPRAENPREGAMGDRNGKLSATALQTALKEGRSVAVSVRGKAHGKLAFIDLAGSERGADSVQFGRNTQQDGANINKSLLALKECIRAMDQGKDHIPFRDSELTKVLRDFFTFANGLCLMIATVASSSTCAEQTLNTLRYADRFIAVRDNALPCINDDEDDNPSPDRDARTTYSQPEKRTLDGRTLDGRPDGRQLESSNDLDDDEPDLNPDNPDDQPDGPEEEDDEFPIGRAEAGPSTTSGYSPMQSSTSSSAAGPGSNGARLSGCLFKHYPCLNDIDEEEQMDLTG